MILPKNIEKSISSFSGVNVSHETLFKLSKYLEILFEENEKYNLIGKNEKHNIWERHVLDSVQLYPHIPKNKKIIDLGSGAGFPAVPLLILGASDFTLIDSQEKKCDFLQKVSRETNISPTILCERVENLRGHRFDLGTSRALSSTKKILQWTCGLCDELLLLKGERVEEELTDAKKEFSFENQLVPSKTNEKSKILKIRNMKKRLAFA